MVWELLLLPFFTLLTKTKADPDPDVDDDDDDDDDTDEEIRNPKALVKSLRDANARLARKNKKLEQRIERLEKQGDPEDDPDEDDEDEPDPRALKLENQFLRVAYSRDDPITDTEAAWDLMVVKGFLDLVKDDGEGMEDAITKLVERYPFLTDGAVESEPPRPSRDTGRTPRRASPQGVYGCGQRNSSEAVPSSQEQGTTAVLIGHRMARALWFWRPL